MEIQPIQILLQMVNFGVVAFFLIKFLYQPIAKVLEVRSEKIKLGMDAAEKNLADRNKLETQVKTELAKARKDAAKLLADAKKQAETEAAEIIAKAKDQAKKVAATESDSAATMAAESIKKAEADIRRLVTATTAKVLENGLTEAEQHKIIDSQIKKLAAVNFV
jgi:F-type H+-transporting ATPase subunit b